jgi:hypothetical protein
MHWKPFAFCVVQCAGFLLIRNWGALDISTANWLGILLLLPGWLILGSLVPWAANLPLPLAILVLAAPLVGANALAWYCVVKVKRQIIKSALRVSGR